MQDTKDSRLKSVTEMALNLAVGYSINYSANFIILPLYGLEGNWFTFLHLGIWYTIISVVRQYALRRLFERFGAKENAYTLCVRLTEYVKLRLRSK